MAIRFDPLPRQSTVSAVIDVMREKIRTGELAAGDTLPPERELAESLAVSRTTLREALRVLSAYGVIETRQKVGATVVNRGLAAALQIQSFHAVHDRESFLDIQNFRRLVEVGSIPDVVRHARPEQLRDLRALLQAMTRDLPAERLAEMDLEFHRRLMTIAGNRTVLQVYEVLERPMREIMTIGKNRHDDTVTDRSHLALLDAIEAGDVERAQQVMVDHLSIGLRYLSESETGEDAGDAA